MPAHYHKFVAANPVLYRFTRSGRYDIISNEGISKEEYWDISASIFGGNLADAPGESAKQCIRAYKKFTADYPDYDIYVMLCAFTASEMASATKQFEELT